MRRVARPFTVGLISDTHNLVRPEARKALAGVDRIVHAGDICGEAVLEDLATIAPITAIRGNNDRGEWASRLQHTEFVELAGVSIYIVHDIADLDIDPAGAGVHAVIHGHSHKPAIEQRDGVLFVNPGSAGPRRFKLPVSIGFLDIAKGAVSARLLTLEIN